MPRRTEEHMIEPQSQSLASGDRQSKDDVRTPAIAPLQPPAGAIVVILLSLVAWAPILSPGFIQTHSGLGAVYDALSVRAPWDGWLPAYGAAGDGPLATWLLTALRTVAGPVDALKLLYAGGFVVAGLGMFALARRLWGDWPGLIVAAVYMVMPYHLATVYVRGALAEAILYALAPWFGFALLAAMTRPRSLSLLAVLLLASALAFANPGLAVVAAALWIVASYALARWRETTEVPKTSVVSPVLPVCSVVIGVVAALAVLWPARGSVLPAVGDWREHFVHFYQLFSPFWGVGESTGGWQDGVSFQIGIAPLALAFLAVWAALDNSRHREQRLTWTLLIAAAIPLALALTTTAPLWGLTRLERVVAYPWQMIGLAAAPLALLGGAGAHAVLQPGRAQLTAVAVLAAVVVLGSYPYLAPRFLNAADLPDLSHPPLAQLGDDILLLDARYDQQAQPGGTVRLTLVWQALRQPQDDLTVFNHLLDGSGVRRGQQDARPQSDGKPTNTWLRGEVVRDEIVIPVAADAPPGDYYIQTGMYLLATLQRLPHGGSERSEVTLGPITVR